MEGLLSSRLSQPGRVCEGRGGGGGLACIWPTGIKERLLLTVGSIGEETEFTHMALPKQSHVASV